jgi:TonB family protein
MAAGKKNGLTLRITGPDGTVHEAVSEAESVIVGSGAQAAVKILDPRVSNLHVMLKVESSGTVTAIDLGSESGTQVGGQRVVGPRTLAPGDVLMLGGSRVEVVFGQEDASPLPAGAEVSGIELQGSVLHRPATVEQVAPWAPEAGNRVVPPGLRSRTPPESRAQVAPAPARKVQRPAVPAYMQEPLPPEALPTKEAKVLQVQLLWGDQLLAVQHFRDGVPVTIGEGKKNFFHVFESEVGASHVLAVGRGELIELRVPESAGVIVTRNGDVRTKDALRSEGKLTSSGKEHVYTLGLHERAEVALGTLTFVVRYVRPSPAVAVNTLTEADYTWFKIVSVSLLAAGAVVAAMLLTPRQAQTDDDIFQNQQRVAKFLVQPQKPIDMKRFHLKGVEEGAKAKGEEGKFGKEEAKKAEADPSKAGTQVVDKSKREKDRQVVGKVGLLGAFKGLKGGASDVFGPGGVGTGVNNALGGLKAGAGLGDAQGVGGLGSRGSGTGGGGTALGLGGLGTKGNGRGAGDGGGIDLTGRGKTVTKIVPGKTTVVGGLDKDVIAKIIRSHQNEIKYCYETELNKNPSLAGKVAVAFTIDPTGAVSEANVTETTLNNSTAENCMLSRIRRWKFPEPKGGGVVAVTYPWIFSPAGE